jgi:hypothetical protein
MVSARWHAHSIGSAQLWTRSAVAEAEALLSSDHRTFEAQQGGNWLPTLIPLLLESRQIAGGGVHRSVPEQRSDILNTRSRLPAKLDRRMPKRVRRHPDESRLRGIPLEIAVKAITHLAYMEEGNFSRLFGDGVAPS